MLKVTLHRSRQQERLAKSHGCCTQFAVGSTTAAAFVPERTVVVWRAGLAGRLIEHRPDAVIIAAAMAAG